MNRLVMMAVAAGAAMAAMAMPTRQQLAKAQEMVSDVTAADVKALKAGAKKPAEVAAKHMELAAQAGSEAEKYLLLQGAFHLYVKGEDYDNAAKAIETMQTEIKDFNPEVIVELCGKAHVRKMQENAPRLYAIKENARRIVFYRKQLPIREAAVRKNPKDPQAQRRLAECHAELGDWPKALEVFAKAGGEFKKMAEGETSGKVPAQELGDFWWGYETKSDTFVYKLHAAELYRKALADDSFKGLARTRAEQRIKEADMVAVDLPHPSASAPVALDATSLAHRWSFTKDFIDSIGKVEAKKRGESVKIESGHCIVQNGGICLGDALLKVGIPSTVEMWYSQASEAKENFIFQSNQVAIRGERGKFVLQWRGWAPKHDLVRFSPGHKLYFAITYDGQNITAYACDTDGDKKLCAMSPVNEDYRYDRTYLYLGGGHPKSGEVQYPSSDGNCTSGKYDEVRIWRVCKSKEDLETSIKAGPDRVVMPKAQPAPPTTSTSASSAASRPAPMTFDLAKDVKLEMLACPAGTFKMSNAPGGPNGDGTHEVKLTRAYWIASSCVTRAMYKAFEADYDRDEKKKGEKKPDDFVTGYARAEAFAGWLNRRFRSKLPRGYVFRMPSEAEWEHAVNAGVIARNWDFEGTLDTAAAVSKKAYAWKFDLSVMTYGESETDPLRVCADNPAWVCRQDAKKRFLLRMDGPGCFRMAVGPDLVAGKR